MITRKLGRILRGTATPFQLFTACLLASMLGFMPGFSQAPGLVLVLLLSLVILNANLAVAGLVALGAKLLSLLLAPLSFAVGRFLLDGPTQSLLTTCINAPVLAWFGFDYYLTTGGLAVGALLGVAVGLLAVGLLNGYRRKMAALEIGSERFQKFTAKGWVKFMTFVFVGGGKGKKSYEELLAKKVGNPIRPLGLVFAGLVVALLIILQLFAAGPIVSMALQQGLQQANGATVDLEQAEVNLGENKLTLHGLAVADPNALDTDLLRVASLEADISGLSLLRKRLQLDRVVLNDASQGEKRAQPGRLIGKPPEPAPAPPPAPGTKTIEDYLENAKVWKERLAQAKEWLDKLSGPEADRTGQADPNAPEKQETLSERLAREVREKGYAQVRATHLVTGAPTLTITELIAQKVRLPELKEETLDIVGTNLSTHPKLLGREPRIVVRSSSDTLGLNLALSSFGPEGGANQLGFHYRGLDMDKVAGQLKLGNPPPVQGGTIDLESQGQWFSAGGVQVDLPVRATLHNTTVSLAGGNPTRVETFVLPISLRGPLDSPRIGIDDKQLSQALLQAGISSATSALKDKAQQELQKQAGDQLGETGGKLLDSFLGGKKPKTTNQ